MSRLIVPAALMGRPKPRTRVGMMSSPPATPSSVLTAPIYRARPRTQSSTGSTGRTVRRQRSTNRLLPLPGRQECDDRSRGASGANRSSIWWRVSRQHALAESQQQGLRHLQARTRDQTAAGAIRRRDLPINSHGAGSLHVELVAAGGAVQNASS
jgi:hypothetical protein